MSSVSDSSRMRREGSLGGKGATVPNGIDVCRSASDISCEICVQHLFIGLAIDLAGKVSLIDVGRLFFLVAGGWRFIWNKHRSGRFNDPIINFVLTLVGWIFLEVVGCWIVFLDSFVVDGNWMMLVGGLI